MFSLTTLHLDNNDLTSLPSGIFSNLTSLTHLYLQSNDLSSLSSSVFDGLSSLKHLGLENNELTSLSGSIFDGIPNVSSIILSNNRLTSLPAGIFEGLTQLSQLHLSWNPTPGAGLSLTASLQKVGTKPVQSGCTYRCAVCDCLTYQCDKRHDCRWGNHYNDPDRQS